MALLLPQSIEQIVLVTEGYHMPRARANFEAAAAGSRLKIVAAPMGLPSGGRLRPVDWLPGREGAEATQLVLHEWLGRVAGA